MGFPRVTAVVVTYNRLGKLQQNVSSVLSQTVVPDRIYVVNNASTDGTKEYLEAMASTHPRIVPVNLKENTGGAGGFATGLGLAVEKTDSEWVWLMDDDGRPESSETLERLLEQVDRIGRPCILNSCVLDPDTNELTFRVGAYRSLSEIPDTDCIEGCAPFNGTLISRVVVEAIGLPRREFFIKWDESEYYIRAMKNGFKSYTVLKSRYLHPAPRRVRVPLPWGAVYIAANSPLKAYYQTRNAIIVGRIHFGFRGMVWAVLKYGVGGLVIGVLSMSEKRLRVLSILRGIVDGLKWRI